MNCLKPKQPTTGTSLLDIKEREGLTDDIVDIIASGIKRIYKKKKYYLTLTKDELQFAEDCIKCYRYRAS